MIGSQEQQRLSKSSCDLCSDCLPVSLSLSCYRQARYWLERYPLPNLFTSPGRREETSMSSLPTGFSVGYVKFPEIMATGARDLIYRIGCAFRLFFR